MDPFFLAALDGATFQSNVIVHGGLPFGQQVVLGGSLPFGQQVVLGGGLPFGQQVVLGGGLPFGQQVVGAVASAPSLNYHVRPGSFESAHGAKPLGTIVVYTDRSTVRLRVAGGEYVLDTQDYYRSGGNTQSSVSRASSMGFHTHAVRKFRFNGYHVVVLIGSGVPNGYATVPFRLPNYQNYSIVPVNLQELLWNVQNKI